MRRYPDVQIDLHLSDTIVDIVEGGFDIAIRDVALDESSFIVRKLAPVKRILCASPDYLARHGMPQTPGDLRGHNCVNFMGLETWVLDSSDGPQSIKTHTVLRTDSGEAVARCKYARHWDYIKFNVVLL